MTKTELHTTFIAGVAKIGLKDNKALADLIESLLAPKNAGAKLDLSTVTKKNAEGKITEILCAKSGKWLPADALNFYKQNNGKGIIGTDGESLHRTSFAGNKAFVEHNKATKATKEAILEDLASGKIDPAAIGDLQKKLKAANDAKPDYSKVVAATPAV